jgi:DNA-binding PucR family transcriptional regulator
MKPAWLDALKSSAGEAVPAVSSMATLAIAQQVVGAKATAWAVAVASRISDEVEKEAAASKSGLPVTGLERQACEACLLVVLCLLHSPDALVPFPPEEAIDQVRLAVRQGASVDRILRVVWMCHTGVQNALLEVVASNVPADRLSAEIRNVTDRTFTFVDGLVRELSAIFDAEQAAWHDRLVASRRDTVDEILTTGTAPEGAAELLGVRLGSHHIAAVLWPAQPMRSVEWRADALRFVDRVTRALGADGSLVIQRADASAEIVWSFAGAPPSDVVQGIVKADLPGGAGLAVGPPGSRVDGFRSSVLGAREAARLGRLCEVPGTWSYERSALLALLTHDHEAAGRFVRHVLAGLCGRDAKSEAIRETLRLYLESGRSRVAAARELHLAANTVAYRVHQAEEYLGHSLDEHPTEMVIALQLARALPRLLN